MKIFTLPLSLGLALALTSFARADVIVWTPDLVHSRADFQVAHLIVSKVGGHIPIESIELTTDTDGLPTHIAAVLDPAHLNTDNQDRDSDLRSATYFDAATYPTMVFKGNSMTRTGKDTFTCSGDLTIRGVTKPVVLSGQIQGRVPDRVGERAGYTATTTIDRRDFGITDAHLSPMGIPLVGNEVKITLTVEATHPK